MKGKLGMVKRELRELGSRSTFKKIFHYTLSSAFSRIWRPWNKTFTCFGINFEYVVTPRSFDNERSVEIPVVQSFIKHTTGKSVLEIGNVLFNYQQPPAEVVDKFEKRPWVINQDIVDFSPGKQYDLIVSISTIEHVGLDVTGQSPVVDYSILPHLVSETCIFMVAYILHGSTSCRNSKRSGDDR